MSGATQSARTTIPAPVDAIDAPAADVIVSGVIRNGEWSPAASC